MINNHNSPFERIPSPYSLKETTTEPNGLGGIMTYARHFTEKDMSDEQLHKELDKLSDEADRRANIYSFSIMLRRMAGFEIGIQQHPECQELVKLLQTGASKELCQFLKSLTIEKEILDLQSTGREL